jgi:hypothetical protein
LRMEMSAINTVPTTAQKKIYWKGMNILCINLIYNIQNTTIGKCYRREFHLDCGAKSFCGLGKNFSSLYTFYSAAHIRVTSDRKDSSLKGKEGFILNV